MLEKGTNMDISERANDKWSLAFGDMDIVFLLHLTTCNKMGRKPSKVCSDFLPSARKARAVTVPIWSLRLISLYMGVDILCQPGSPSEDM